MLLGLRVSLAEPCQISAVKRHAVNGSWAQELRIQWY
jgi:hypothetical protein